MQYRQVELNPEQERAASHGDGPLLVLAGAGTGKTRVLVHRIARLVERRIPPWKILAVTFSNKAAGEMRERLREVLGMAADKMWIGTFHGTCAKLLRIHGQHIGLDPNFTIFDDDDQKRVIAALLKENELDKSATPQGVRSRIDRAKNRGLDPIEVAAGAGPSEAGGYAEEILATIYPQYQQRLEKEGAVDFNDLLLKVLQLTEHPQMGPELASRFVHVLVDEFQDTNQVQYRLVRHFAGQTRNLTVVGDDDQSIYSWRGAETRNLLEFDSDFPDAEVVKLEENYRSTQLILDAANGVIACNRHRYEKALWTRRGTGEPVLWEECADDRGEADFVARAMRGLVEEEGRDYGDLAVLYRTHAQSRVLEEQLRRHGIAYRIVGGVSFFQRREIKDIIAYARLLLHPGADLCFERVVNTPPRGIGKTTVERVKIHARNKNLPMMDAARACAGGAMVKISARTRKKLGEFIELIDGLKDVLASGASVSELMIQIVERSGYRARLDLDSTPEADDRLNNLAELVNMASDFDEETDGSGTLVAFDERISLTASSDGSDGRGTTSVTLMTIHAAKGLEFPVVFLCGMEDGLFPSLRERPGVDEGDSLAEERRLAYVAMTRAQERLVLTNARVRRHRGELRMSEPSRFLDEIPEETMAVRARRPAPEEREVRRPAVRRRARQNDGYGDYDNDYGEALDPGFDPGPNYDDFDQSPHHDDVPTYDVDRETATRRADPGSQARRSGVRAASRRSVTIQRPATGRSRAVDRSSVLTMEGSEEPAIDAGSAVNHSSFGEGRVLSAEGRGKNRKLLIDFSEYGLKTVFARFVEPLP